MDKQHKILLISALIGGAVGIGATLLLRAREKEGSSMDTIGKVVCHLGEVIETSREGKALMKEAEKRVHKGEGVIVSAIDLAAAGVEFWNQLKKAG